MIIDFESVKNARDLGNIKNSDGLYVKTDRLIRAADLSAATPRDLERLKTECDLGAIVDFRDTVSARKYPDRVVSGVSYYSCPALSLMDFTTEEESLQFDEIVKQDPLGMLYKAYRALAVDAMAHVAYKTFFRVLLQSDGQGVLWHCTQGKDRTGVAAILLLSALDVPLDAIEEDYFITNRMMRSEYDALKSMWPDEETRSFMRTEMFVRPDCFELYMDTIRREFGGMDEYLERVLGVSNSQRAKLKELYLIQERK